MAGGSNRCVFLTNGASLSGFTLNQRVCFRLQQRSYGGGGANDGILTNCTLSGNFARANTYGNGGGAYNAR